MKAPQGKAQVSSFLTNLKAGLMHPAQMSAGFSFHSISFALPAAILVLSKSTMLNAGRDQCLGDTSSAFHLVLAMANSSIFDSVATFEKQADTAGLPTEWIRALKNANIDTLGKLSYAVTAWGSSHRASPA